MNVTSAHHTQDWEALFRSGDTPWEDAEVAPVVVELFREHVPQVAAVLEIGCGLGTTALWLARQGHHVVACDIAPEAVRSLGSGLGARGWLSTCASPMCSPTPFRSRFLMLSSTV